MIALEIISLIIFATCVHFYILNNLYFWQIKSYKLNKYFRFYKNIKIIIFYSIVSILGTFSLIFIKNYIFYTIFSLIFSIFYLVLELTKYFKSKKIKLKITAKIKRVFIANIIVFYAIILSIYLLLDFKTFSILITTSMLYKDIIIAGVILCCLPIEKLINRKYIVLAKNKLSYMTTLHKVGITGSVGKTSVKRYLSVLLEDQKTVVSPKSFNTPLGLTRCINSMPYDSEIFVAEMGARKRGQINDLCQMIKPDIAIITNISPAHIESFGSVENVYLTKKELSDCCNGVAIFNLDNNFVKQIYDERQNQKVGVSIMNKADYYATDIICNETGTCFILHTPTSQHHVATQLLGKHNVTNILLAVAAACQLESEENIVSKIGKLVPEEHRLQLIRNSNGVNIIDDSYNASADSISSALETLSLFSGRKIIASPGMVEGGKMQYTINHDFGAKAGKFVDMFIIVNNTNKKAIADGLLSVDFKNIYYAKSLKDAEILFKSLLRSGDTLLLLNDLPDDYN